MIYENYLKSQIPNPASWRDAWKANFSNPESQILSPEETYEKTISNPESCVLKRNMKRQYLESQIPNPVSWIDEKPSRIPNPKSCALKIYGKITLQIPNPKSCVLSRYPKRLFQIPNPASWREIWKDNFWNPKSCVLNRWKTISNPKSQILRPEDIWKDNFSNPESQILSSEEIYKKG